MIGTKPVGHEVRVTREGDNFRLAIAHFAETARVKLAAAGAMVGADFEQGVSETKAIEEQLAQRIRENPVRVFFVAIGLAVGLGLAIAYC